MYEIQNVLSLFDGMSCGQIALNRVGIKYKNYYASEVKNHAINVTKHNYPNTIHIGDVTKLDFNNYKEIDLLIGGSPCQDFSIANKERKGLNGLKSSLFYKWLEAKEVINPKYFLLENVNMDINDNNYITKLLGVMPVRINSALVSAQMRDRYYWTNIPGSGGLFGDIIEQPKDKKIFLKDILESGYTERKKAFCLLASSGKRSPHGMLNRKETFSYDVIFENLDLFNYYLKNKSIKWYKNYEIANNCKINNKDIRQFSTKELEKLQTIPEGYTSILTREHAANLIGDGWTVDVIAHILKGIIL